MVRKLLYLLFPIVFFGCWQTFYALNQNAAVWENGLGRVTDNYQNLNDPNNSYNIERNDKPYLQVTNENVLHWDAGLYQAISENGYRPVGGYQEYKAAFFPLFPLVWRWSGLPNRSIGLLNFALFAGSVLLLAGLFKPTFFTYCLAFFSPAAVVYWLPYSEAVFILAVALAAFGSFKNSYAVFFLGMFLTGFSRAAMLFMAPLILALAVLDIFRGRKPTDALVEAFGQMLPVCLGVCAAMVLQGVESGDFLSLFKAQSHWPRAFGWPKTIVDWSQEGFAMTTAGVWFLSVPALLVMGFEIFKGRLPRKTASIFSEDLSAKRRFWFRLSLSYLAFMLVYKWLMEQGSMHSLSRYLWASPFFYIALFSFPNQKRFQPGRNLQILLGASLMAMVLWMIGVGYGRPHFNFAWLGMWIGVGGLILHLYQNRFSSALLSFFIVCLFFLSLCWQTFLYNMFLNNGWIYT